MSLVSAIAPEVGIQEACDNLDVSRATFYRRQNPQLPKTRPKSWRALSQKERSDILTILYDPRFVDASPAEVHAALLDEGVYFASVRTLYRILRGEHRIRERRAVRVHPTYERPELVATRPNQVWSWDITKIRGPERRTWFHLYVILDIYSRKVVGWMLAAHETGELAERFIAETMEREGVQPGTLTLHSDRGTSMRSKTVAELLSDLEVTKSHSRPRVSNDNPFSESQFKTMKYSPFFPGSFVSIEEGRSFFTLFFPWYNNEHHHSGIAMMTPNTVHEGRVEEVVAERQKALNVAYKNHPERFVNGRPEAKRPPAEVWINRPKGQEISIEGVDASASTPRKQKNAATKRRPNPAGAPAQARVSSAEGVDGLADAPGRVPPLSDPQRF